MTRATVCLLLLAAFLPVVGCGDVTDESADLPRWLARADEAFRAADDSARKAQASASEGVDEETASLWADAVEGWREAARYYRSAFRLEDPVGERREARALLAFRVGRAMSNAARKRPAARASEGLAHEGLLWFRQAEAIRPEMRQVHYERALLYESEVPGVRDLERARMAYEAYVASLEEIGRIPESEQPRVERARERAQELAPSEPN